MTWVGTTHKATLSCNQLIVVLVKNPGECLMFRRVLNVGTVLLLHRLGACCLAMSPLCPSEWKGKAMTFARQARMLM